MDKSKLLMEEYIPDIIDADKIQNGKYADRYVPVTGRKRRMLEISLRQIQNYIKEATFSSDIDKFVPKVIPIYRRIFPFLIPHEVAGYQPLTVPAGLIFAMRSHYTNDSANSIDMDASAAQTSSKILLVTDLSAFSAGSDVVSSGGAIGKVRYLEDKAIGKVMLVEVTSGTFAAAETIDNANPFVSAAATITSVYDNEAGYNYFLQNYSGPYTTANAEQLSTNMKEMGMTIDSKNVTTKERWLKAIYTMSLAQDLKNLHGLDIDEELNNILGYEIAQSINREIIDAINDNAAATSFNAGSGGDADGRWQAERHRAFYIELVRKANQIAIDTRRGPGNFIIASTDAVTSLEALQSFQYAPVGSDVDTAKFDSSFMGNIGKRFKVYLDTFAQSDYATVGYKGMSDMDGGVIYSPYVPVQVYRGIGEDDAKPRIFFQSRDAVTTSLFGTTNYYKKVTVTNLF